MGIPFPGQFPCAYLAYKYFHVYLVEMKQNHSQKRKNRKKITLGQVIKWIFILLACLALILGIIGRVQHYINIHIK